MNGRVTITLCVAVFFLLFYPTSSLFSQVYVSPAGSDTGTGSIDNPYYTIAKAMSYVTAGDTIYMRGGVYQYTYQFRTNRSGNDSQYIHLWAYPGETPVLDFSTQTRASSSQGIYLTNNYWYVKGLTVQHAGDNGIFIRGAYNKVENCTLYDNEDSGLQISNGGSYNLIRNCDSYENYDSSGHGEDADGFAPKLTVGPGNKFVGCRAWGNSDDGWDMYETAYPVLVDSCWAFHNGYNIWGDASFQGDGNGFKVGGNYVPAQHIVTRCVAFDNNGKGFDQNNNTGAVTIMNCTAYRNYKTYVFGAAPDTLQHVFKNNISYFSSLQIISSSVQDSNSWQKRAVLPTDFLSLDTSLAHQPRREDGSLPVNNFLRLAPTSSFINGGEDVGLAYSGSGPDLGAFEYQEPDGVDERNSLPLQSSLLQNYPNPFNPRTRIRYSLQQTSLVKLKVYDMMGKLVSLLVDGQQGEGNHEIDFDASLLSSGVYYYTLLITETRSGYTYHDVKAMVYCK